MIIFISEINTVNKLKTMTVQTTYYRDFALFCEAMANPGQPSSLLLEASTLLNSPIAKNVGAAPLIKYLHGRGMLAHDQPYTAVRPRDITWSELKERSSMSWVFFTGINGTVAVHSGGSGSNNEFTMVFSPEEGQGEMKGKKYTKSSEMLNDIKSKLGAITGMYYGGDPKERLLKRDARVKQRAFVKGAPMDPNELLKKFRPLIEKSVTAALANVKGHLMDSIKNDSFENAKAYFERAKTLRELLDHLDYHQEEYDLSESNQLKQAMSGAIAMTASHYYPELTGAIRKERYYGGGGAYGVANDQGRQKLLQDIAQGNKEKVGTILYYFKRILVAL